MTSAIVTHSQDPQPRPRERQTIATAVDRAEARTSDVNSNAPRAPHDQASATSNATDLQALLAQLGLRLTRDEERTIEAAAQQVPVASMMRTSGLFLNKLGMPVERDAMQSVYAMRSWTSDRRAESKTDADDITALIAPAAQGAPRETEDLSRVLASSVAHREHLHAAATVDAELANVVPMSNQGASTNSDNAGTNDDEKRRALRALAQQLLNSQDGGTLAYHFGSVPVIVANQLIELDLVMFRNTPDAAQQHDVRRLVMSLKTETLGRLEVVAQSVDTHVSVSISAESAHAADALSAGSAEVKDLIQRLGWNVDAVNYRAAAPTRAADRIVEHVLASGTLDTFL